MKRKIQKNRISLSINIPLEICQDMCLRSGDKLDFRVEKNEIIARPVHNSAKNDAQATATTRKGGLDLGRERR